MQHIMLFNSHEYDYDAPGEIWEKFESELLSDMSDKMRFVYVYVLIMQRHPRFAAKALGTSEQYVNNIATLIKKRIRVSNVNQATEK